MSRYAQKTEVSPEASRGEIERTLRRYGADSFMYGWDEGRALVGFRAHGRHIRFVLPLPRRDDREFTHYIRGTVTRTAVKRSETEAEKRWEQACRQRWRALALAVKAKLEAVESGIATFDDEFAAYILLPNGQTVGDHLRPALERAYASGQMPASLLPELPGAAG